MGGCGISLHPCDAFGRSISMSAIYSLPDQFTWQPEAKCDVSSALGSQFLIGVGKERYRLFIRWSSVRPTSVPVISFPGQTMWQPDGKM